MKNFAEIAQNPELDKMNLKKLGKDLCIKNNKNEKNLKHLINKENLKTKYNNYIKENNNEKENKNKIQIFSDSLNINNYSKNSRKIFDDKDIKKHKDIIKV